MKSSLYISLAIGIFILTIHANVTNAQTTWSTPDAGVTVYKTNTSGNVGIGTTTPTDKLHIYNGTSSANIIAESNISASNGAIGRIRIKNENTGDIYNISLRKASGNTELLQSAYDASTTTWREFIYFNYNTKKYEMRSGIGVAEFKNSGNILFSNTGNVGIGETNPSSKLAVNGSITCKEVEVSLTGWSDFVFDDHYTLPPLADVSMYIKKNKHLPGIPPTDEILNNGVKLGNMNALLLQKIEELTLYMIRLQDENEALKARVSMLEQK
jgi:hypothetical protein